MRIRVDSREGELHAQCLELAAAFPAIEVETAQLPLGDVIICEDDGREREFLTPSSLVPNSVAPSS